MVSLFTPILVERQHFIPQVPEKQLSVCYAFTALLDLFQPSLLSPPPANCNDLFLLISSNFQPTHLKKKPFVLPKKGSRELKYTVIMHTHLCSHFVYTNTDASFVFSCEPENISVRVLLSTFSYGTF